jgi:hypothetical protein
MPSALPRPASARPETATGSSAVVYLNTLPGDDPGPPRPEERQGLARVIELVTGGRAGIVLVPWHSVISPLAEGRDRFMRRVQHAGGVLRFALRSREATC